MQRPSWEFGEITGTEEGGQGVCVEIVVSQQIIEEVSGVNELSWSLLITLIFCNTLLVRIQSVITSMTTLLIMVIVVHTPNITSTTKSIQ